MPEITIECSDESMAAFEREAAKTGWTVKALMVRWIESGMLNAGPVLRAECAVGECSNPKPTWWSQELREYVCKSCAEKMNAADPRKDPFPRCYDSKDRFREFLTREELIHGVGHGEVDHEPT